LGEVERVPDRGGRGVWSEDCIDVIEHREFGVLEVKWPA
jgi:hypothetical protein